VIIQQPFTEEALHHGFLNLTGFAEYIRPYVEKEAQKQVSNHAIKMALSRMERPEELSKYVPDFQSKHTIIMGNLTIMSVIRSSIVIQKIHALFSKKSE